MEMNTIEIVISSVFVISVLAFLYFNVIGPFLDKKYKKK